MKGPFLQYEMVYRGYCWIEHTISHNADGVAPLYINGATLLHWSLTTLWQICFKGVKGYWKLSD